MKSTNMAQQNSIEVATAEFQAGVTAVLRSWPALKTAVESGWGGSLSNDKAEFLRSHILNCFDYTKAKPSVDSYTLEDDLAIYMEEEFSVTVEDDSEKQLAQLLYNMYEKCGNGDFSLAREVVEKANQAASIASKPVVQSNGELDEDSDDEMETTTTPTPTGASSSMNIAQEYAGNFLFGAPSTQQQQPEDLPPPRQLGETAPEKSEIEVDDDGFATVPTRRQGKR